MGKITVTVAAELEASAEDAYATIADYRQGHPAILPRAIYDLRVEQGGYGAGTIHRFKTRVLGVEQSFYQIVSEPEPGRVLVERDIEPGQNYCTTFTVTPLEQGRRSWVEITTTLDASPGLKGFVERVTLPLILSPIYREELHLLERVARKQGAAKVRS
ncbi:MAG: SRPBCC family protein [Ktedonobacteraceae bacterium]|nr:SRPBCC family protein [Ktedonobacteraceae bacterium]